MVKEEKNLQEEIETLKKEIDKNIDVLHKDLFNDTWTLINTEKFSIHQKLTFIKLFHQYMFYIITIEPCTKKNIKMDHMNTLIGRLKSTTSIEDFYKIMYYNMKVIIKIKFIRIKAYK